jgi:plasmid maintenance system antidote protein VapI
MSDECACQQFKRANELPKGENLVLLGLIHKSGLNQAKFAWKIGMDRAYLTRIINGSQRCPLKFKLKISHLLGVDSRVIFPVENER